MQLETLQDRQLPLYNKENRERQLKQQSVALQKTQFRTLQDMHAPDEMLNLAIHLLQILITVHAEQQLIEHQMQAEPSLVALKYGQQFEQMLGAEQDEQFPILQIMQDRLDNRQQFVWQLMQLFVVEQFVQCAMLQRRQVKFGARMQVDEHESQTLFELQ